MKDVTLPGLVEGLCLLSGEQLRLASGDELAHTIGVLVEEQKRRALEAGDPEAVAEAAFEWGFDRTGMAMDPRLVGGLLVCPGAKSERSAASHECRYVSVDGTWVWEHGDVVHDAQRTAERGKSIRQSVTVLPAWEGMTFDVVRSIARSGPCQMRDAVSYVVRDGALVVTASRVRKPPQHR